MTQVVARNASASLATYADDVVFGFNGGATGTATFGWSGGSPLTDSTLAAFPGITALLTGSPVGIAGEVLGVRFFDTSITATLDIDTFYYDVDA